MDAHRNVVKVFMGYDPREAAASEVAEHTLLERASVPVSLTHLRLKRLQDWGLYRRPMRRNSVNGTLVDEISEAPMSTEFANSRFLTPLLAHTGWALFVDCDVVFMGDVAELFALADPRYAVMCVKHGVFAIHETKMDGQPQTAYPRKNWSSVMLFNCDHPDNRRLTLKLLNEAPGRVLHAFEWLDDAQIGELPPQWNWLVGIQPRPERPKLAHFTLGGPWLPRWEPKQYDHIWLSASARLGT